MSPPPPSDTAAENAAGAEISAGKDAGSDDGQIDGQMKGSEGGQLKRAESEWDSVGMESALVLSPS